MFHLMYRTSIKGRKDIASYLLNPEDDDFEISDSYTSRVAEIFGVILKSLGIKIEFIDDVEQLCEYDDLSINVFSYNDIDYMCTEYEFMIIKRYLDTQEKILKEVSLIDKDELKQKVLKELVDTEYLIGPSTEDEYNKVIKLFNI